MAAELAGVPKRGRLRAVALNLALLLGSLLLTLLLAEGAVRLVAPQQLIQVTPWVYLPRDSVGYTFRPDLNTTINTGERRVHMRTDVDGYRVGAYGRLGVPTEVLLLGDSFMAALQVEFEQSVAGLIEAKLPGAIGRPVAVRNAGVQGWGPSEYFLWGRRVIEREPPAAVVVALYLGNDVTLGGVLVQPAIRPLQLSYFRLPQRLAWSEIVAAWLRPLNDYLETHSHLFILAKTRSHALLMRVGLTPEYFPDEFRKSEVSSPRWRETAEVCTQLAEVARRHKVPIFFVMIPAPYQVDQESFQQYVAAFSIDSTTVDLDQPNRLLGGELRARGLEVYDVLPLFRREHARGVELFGRIDRHLSLEGHAVLYQFLEGPLRAHLTQASP